MHWALLLTLTIDTLTIEPAAQASRVRRAMQPGLTAQRLSVAAQRATTRPNQGNFCAPVPAERLESWIAVAARAQGLNPAVIREVARQESAFRPCAVSRSGAQGLMQIMPGVQQELRVRDAFDGEEAIHAGSRLLRELLDRYHGNLALALAAYNAGPSQVDRSQGIPPIRETQRYVRDIMLRLKPPNPRY